MTDAVANAGRFIEKDGRDIEQALFTYHFHEGSRDEVLETLGRYQNADGGFGHGLEPDIRAPDSNPFATELALHICLSAETPPDHPLLRRTVEYLEDAQDEEGNWRFSPGVYEHPLAPWFQGWTWPALNPSCTIAGYLTALGLGSDRLHARVAALFDRLARPDGLLSDDYYTVRPYAYYFLPAWEHPRRELYLSGVLWWLLRQGVRGKEMPFDFIRSRDTYTGRLLPDGAIETGLDAIERAQLEDGGWPTPYDPHWRGWTTVENLLVLRAFGRV